MNTSIISFSLAEKFAVVKALDALILVDGKVHDEEINILTEFMRRIDFDSNFDCRSKKYSYKTMCHNIASNAR